MKTKLPISAWGYVILAALVRIKPISYYKFSPLQLAFGQGPNIFHLIIFGCVIYVPIIVHHNAQKWVLKEGWEYILDINNLL